jgi:hypothetical protein
MDAFFAVYQRTFHEPSAAGFAACRSPFRRGSAQVSQDIVATLAGYRRAFRGYRLRLHRLSAQVSHAIGARFIGYRRNSDRVWTRVSPAIGAGLTSYRRGRSRPMSAFRGLSACSRCLSVPSAGYCTGCCTCAVQVA